MWVSMNFRVENLIVSAKADKEFDLEKVHSVLKGSHYTKDQMPGVHLRLENPKAAILILSTGKIVCTGTRTMEDAKKAITTVVEELCKEIKDIKVQDFVVESLVSSANFDRMFDLEAVSKKVSGDVEYNKEKLNAIIYKVPLFNVTALLFDNGKVIAYGKATEAQIKTILEGLQQQLEEAQFSAATDEIKKKLEAIPSNPPSSATATGDATTGK
ncbi:MAG: hypothetical protein QW728_04810 [Thermoplasmata archaeon]